MSPFQLNFLIQCCFDGIFLIKGILSERPAQFSLIRIKFHLVPRHIQFRTLCVQYLPCRRLLVRALILFPDPLFRLFLSLFAFFPSSFHSFRAGPLLLLIPFQFLDLFRNRLLYRRLELPLDRRHSEFAFRP